ERQMNKQPDIQDPGAPMMKMLVRDLDTVVANAKKANAPIVTKGGAPVTAPTPIGSARAIIMRDPDGYFVEAIQATPAIIGVTDAMASGMAIRIGHIRELLAKIKANGGRVLSRNEELVEWSETIRNVFVKDPNGLNLELVGNVEPNLP